MYPLTCPFEPYPCGRDSPKVKLSLNQSETIYIDKYFKGSRLEKGRMKHSEMCYFVVEAEDQVSDDQLEDRN